MSWWLRKNFGDICWSLSEGTVRGDVSARCAVSLAAAEAVLSKMADPLLTGLGEEKGKEQEDRERDSKAGKAEQEKEKDGATDTLRFHQKNGAATGQKGNLSGENQPGSYSFTKPTGCCSYCVYSY